MANQRIRSKKFFITTLNERFPDNFQFNILTLLNDDSSILINQYAKAFTLSDLGEFDISKENNFGVLSFFPNDNRPNDYTYAFSSFNLIAENPTEEFKSESLGDLVRIGSLSTRKSEDFSKIIEIPLEFSSSKLEIQSSMGDNFQFDELSFTHNSNLGVGISVLSSVRYGTIFSGPLIGSSPIGLGTYFPYIENDKVFIDFIPAVSPITEIDFNISAILIGNTSFSVEGSRRIQNVTLLSKKTVIPQSPDPNQILATVVASHNVTYQASYYIAQCTDLTNNNTQISEIVVINSRTESYLVEYGSIFTEDRIGTFSALKTLDTELLFTPLNDVDVEVVVFQVQVSSSSQFPDLDRLNLDNFEIVSGLNRSGVDGNVVLDFNLTHKLTPIFERLFNASNPSIVNLNDNTILLPKHFFVTGEQVKYVSDEFGSDDNLNSIGIVTTNIPGIGITDKLPTEAYVIRVDNTKIKLAKTAEDALKILPEYLNFTSLGVGLIHKITSTQQNTKSLISIDNIIQSPIRFTNTATTLSEDIDIDDFSIIVDNEKLFSFNDLIKINNEIMRVSSIGIGSTNSIIVVRNFLGTNIQQHSAGSVIKKLKGNYNIVDNKLYFSSPPYGLTPSTSEDDSFDERDYFGIQTKSTFDGRVFLRSGVPLSVDKAYTGNHIFDSLNDQFNGLDTQFTLKEDNENISGISTNNAIVLLNNIYQSPKGTPISNVLGYYELLEELDETKINFDGSAFDNPSDINTTSIPYGGVIVSFGSTDGSGYQPLVSAGGTALVSVAGTISEIFIGNIGSGYRVGIQTQVNVGVKTYSVDTPNIEIIGTASIENGSITGVQITNPGLGYTFTNPPEVVFDDPLGYTNIPLIYSSQSQPGIGTQATIDIVIGNGTNIIDFNISNFGYGYNVGDILTVPINEIVGIPTIFDNNLFSEFQILIDETYNVDFSGWSMGEFVVLDNLNSRFNGRTKNFQIFSEGKPISISKRKGSPIELDYVLLVFINDVLQIPFKDYTFSGSIIKFNSAPKGPSDNPPFNGDTSKIIFYKGTEGIDVNFVEILDSPKIGDYLTIKSDSKNLTQKSRIIEFISSIDIVDTNKYSDIGVSEDENLLRPVTWCKQTDDIYILGEEVTKDRKIYNPYINPVSYLIKDLNINDTEIFVDSAKLFFDYSKESIPSNELNKIEIISNSENVGEYENVSNVRSIEGDFGIIVGIGSTSVSGISDTCLVFDLFIPQDSYLRDNELNSGISTEGISGIQTGYRFVVSGTNNGSPNLSFDAGGNMIGIGSIFLDNIYECLDFTIQPSFLLGIGITSVVQVVCPVNTYENIEFTTPLGYIENFSFTGETRIPSESDKIYTNILPIGGSGINASFDIQRNSVGEISSITLNDGGTGYNVGDQLTIAGNLIGLGGEIDTISFVGSIVDFSEIYFGIEGSTSGPGFEAAFDIERDQFGEIIFIDIAEKGSNYNQNDTITISGSDVGGVDIVDDIIITVTDTEIKTISFVGNTVDFSEIYFGIQGTTSGFGFEAAFDIERDQFGEIIFIDIAEKGSNYNQNDTITISGSDVGGVDIVDDIIITVTDTEIKTISFVGTVVAPIKTYFNLSGTTLGSGIGAEFNVERDEFGEVISIQVDDPGFNYEINDTITISGSDVGGVDIVDDIIITVTDTEIKTISFVGTVVAPIKTYFNLSGTTLGSGIGAEFNVERDEFGEVISIQVDDPGFNYEINDTITISGSDVGGVDIVDDIIITVVSINDLIIITVDGISGRDKFIFGKYSWGKFDVPFRASPKSFSINNPAVIGIGTNPIIRRKNPLRTDLYLP